MKESQLINMLVSNKINYNLTIINNIKTYNFKMFNKDYSIKF